MERHDIEVLCLPYDPERVIGIQPAQNFRIVLRGRQNWGGVIGNVIRRVKDDIFLGDPSLALERSPVDDLIEADENHFFVFLKDFMVTAVFKDARHFRIRILLGVNVQLLA